MHNPLGPRSSPGTIGTSADVDSHVVRGNDVKGFVGETSPPVSLSYPLQMR